MRSSAAPPAPTRGNAPSIPAPPPALTRHLEEAIRAVAPDQSLATASPETLLGAAEHLFAAMLRGGCVTRTSAIELLTVDALVTYAFERGSDDPEHMEAQAQRAMIKLATLPATVGAS